MKATYNIIIKAFEDFCTNHQQINTFFSGGNWDFQTLNNIYPAVIMLPQPSRIEMGQYLFTFNIFVCDLLNEDMSNIDEIYSDTAQIIGDMVAYFKDNDDYEFYLDESSVELQPSDETLDDIVAGWVATINIQVPYSGSTCGLPISTP